MEWEVYKDYLSYQQEYLQAEHWYNKLDECQEVEHGQRWQQEYDERHNKDPKIKFKQWKVIVVNSVSHDVELFAIKQINQSF